MGLPVVAQAVAGVPEVVAHPITGLLTPSGDVEAYSAAIAQLLIYPDQRQTMADAARAQVTRHHTLPAASSQLSALLNRALETHHV
jgi:glycosyltransferase involved in cell wall biosynthesis